MATFDLNLHNSNINPSTHGGLNFFLKSIEERKEDAKLKVLQSNIKNIMSAFESNAHKFGWNAHVNVFPANVTGQNNKLILKKLR